MKNNRAPHGWWILPSFLLCSLFVCALLVALLMPHAGTNHGALAVIVISFVAAVIGGLLSVWVLR